MASPASARFSHLMSAKDEVFALWVDQIQKDVPDVRNMPPLALLDNLHGFYDQLIFAITTPSPEFQTSAAKEHGAQRARSTTLTASGIAREYQLLRSILVATWEKSGIALTPDTAATLNQAFDAALLAALEGFSRLKAQIREQFFCALTHDLRSPLSTASAAIALVKQANDTTRAQRFADMALRQIVRMNGMIENLLDMMVSDGFSTTLELNEVELHGLVSEAIAGVTLASGRDIRLHGGRLDGKWNADALSRAIENLLNNAVKYSVEDSVIDVCLKQEMDRAIIEVTNIGTPIPASQREAIFELLREKSRESRHAIPGWGIGLPYVRSVAERHGGRISVNGDDLQTTFVFELPLKL